jgi:hypothetical protein
VEFFQGAVVVAVGGIDAALEAGELLATTVEGPAQEAPRGPVSRFPLSAKQNTGLLAAEGLAGAQIVCFVLKQAAGRLKPSDIPPDGNLRNTWFKYKGGLTHFPHFFGGLCVLSGG